MYFISIFCTPSIFFTYIRIIGNSLNKFSMVLIYTFVLIFWAILYFSRVFGLIPSHTDVIGNVEYTLRRPLATKLNSFFTQIGFLPMMINEISSPCVLLVQCLMLLSNVRCLEFILVRVRHGFVVYNVLILIKYLWLCFII